MSSKQTFGSSSIHPSTSKHNALSRHGGKEFAHEPGGSKEEVAIWKSQVLIPFHDSNRTFSYLGPLYPLELCHEKIPKYILNEKYPLLAFKRPINLRFLNSLSKVFRSMPGELSKLKNFKTPSIRSSYLKWLHRVESQKASFWKEIGIYDVIQLNKENLVYNFSQLLSSAYFWNPLTCTFNFPSGMLTVTLLDVAAIVGLKPIGKLWTHDLESQLEITPDLSSTGYSKFIKANIDKTNEISDQEHVAFILFWLHHCFFCSRSFAIGRGLLPLARSLHEGKAICLSKILLASLYESLTVIYNEIKASDTIPANIYGPLWLLQLWLNSICTPTFTSPTPIPNSDIPYGCRLARLTTPVKKKGLVKAFHRHFEWFLNLRDQEPNFSFIFARKEGPEWLTQKIPSDIVDKQFESLEIWKNFLTCQPIYATHGAKTIKVVFYQPNLVARQFGFSQLVPFPMLQVLGKPLAYSTIDWKDLKAIQNRLDGLNLQLSFFEYEPSYLTTQSFEDWWTTYYVSTQKPFKECFLDTPGDESLMRKRDPHKKDKVVVPHPTTSSKQIKATKEDREHTIDERPLRFHRPPQKLAITSQAIFGATVETVVRNKSSHIEENGTLKRKKITNEGSLAVKRMKQKKVSIIQTSNTAAVIDLSSSTSLDVLATAGEKMPNIEIHVPGTSPSKEGNGKQTCPERKEQQNQGESLDFESLNSQDMSALGFDFEDFFSKLNEDPVGAVSNFLAKVSTSSQFQMFVAGATVSENGNNVVEKTLNELRSIVFSESIIDHLRQGQDPSIRLESIQANLNTHRELFAPEKITEMEKVIQFLNDLSSNYKGIGSLQDSKSSIEEKFDTCKLKLWEASETVAKEKEKKEKYDADCIESRSHIERLENELRDFKARDEILHSKKLAQTSKLKTSIDALACEMKHFLKEKKRLEKVEEELAKAMTNFEDQKKKYQALRDLLPF